MSLPVCGIPTCDNEAGDGLFAGVPRSVVITSASRKAEAVLCEWHFDLLFDIVTASGFPD